MLITLRGCQTTGKQSLHLAWVFHTLLLIAQSLCPHPFSKKACFLWGVCILFLCLLYLLIGRELNLHFCCPCFICVYTTIYNFQKIIQTLFYKSYLKFTKNWIQFHQLDSAGQENIQYRKTFATVLNFNCMTTNDYICIQLVVRFLPSEKRYDWDNLTQDEKDNSGMLLDIVVINKKLLHASNTGTGAMTEFHCCAMRYAF